MISATQMTLGELRSALAECPPSGRVIFAFGRSNVVGLDSYRGYYCECAVEFGGPYAAHDKHMTVERLTELVDAALGGDVFHGYKGGEYKFNSDTPLWASQYGRGFDACIVAVTRSDIGDAIIETASSEACGR